MNKYVVYRDIQKQWRWTFYAGNGEAIAVSSESYKTEADCKSGIKVMQDFGGQAHAIVETSGPVKVKVAKKARRK